MKLNKIIRSICVFTPSISNQDVNHVNVLTQLFEHHGFVVQTKRICTNQKQFDSLKKFDDGSLLLSVGTLPFESAILQLRQFYKSNNISFNVDLTHEIITLKHLSLLFEIIKNNPSKLFHFTYVFNSVPSSPFYPSANFEKPGFSIGLQMTDLSSDCDSLEQWFDRMKVVWKEIVEICRSDKNFLGIDSSIAPLASGNSSLVNFIKRLGISFDNSVMTNTYMKMTECIKKDNPIPIGLCGLMLPALEDFELAQEYENGNFSIERNIFLSLHSGLGIDTFPIGVDEDKNILLNIFQLIQGLSNKYKKPLSIRFVSDGIAKIGQTTHFQNQYLKDVAIRPL